jgi:hypothetical protein
MRVLRDDIAADATAGAAVSNLGGYNAIAVLQLIYMLLLMG